MYGRGYRWMAVAVIALLILGVVTVFVMMQMVGNIHPDPHDHHHDYVLGGSLYGKDCTGTGSSARSTETSAEYLYTISYTLESADAKVSSHFGLFFDLDETMDPRYYRDLGTEELDGMTVHVWQRTENDITYTIWAGKYCTVQKFCIQSDDIDVTGNIVKG